MALNRVETSVFALGGLGEVGKNMYCVEHDNTLIIIDSGVRFPESDFPGVDYVIPDFSYLIKKFSYCNRKSAINYFNKLKILLYSCRKKV